MDIAIVDDNMADIDGVVEYIEAFDAQQTTKPSWAEGGRVMIEICSRKPSHRIGVYQRCDTAAISILGHTNKRLPSMMKTEK